MLLSRGDKGVFTRQPMLDGSGGLPVLDEPSKLELIIAMWSEEVHQKHVKGNT